MMNVERISKETASIASHIYALSWKTAYRNIVPQKYLDELSLERWTPLLQNSSFDGYLLKDNDEFVATSSISAARDDNMEGWGEIISIYVLPKHYYKGYGKKLLSFVISKLQEKGFSNIYLWVLEDNYQARKFYERNGFIAHKDKVKVNIGGKDLIEIRYINIRQ